MYVLLLFWRWVFQCNLVTDNDNAVMQSIREQLIYSHRHYFLLKVIVPACFPCWVSLIHLTLTKTNSACDRPSRRSKRVWTDSWRRNTDHASSRGQNWRVTSCHYQARYQAPGPVSCWRLRTARTQGSDSDLIIGNLWVIAFTSESSSAPRLSVWIYLSGQDLDNFWRQVIKWS